MADKRADSDSGKKKRRRKRTGLRVPSDNVPRRADDDEEPTPPPADDPRLAVSLAGAFGAGEAESTPVPAPPVRPAPSAPRARKPAAAPPVNLGALATEHRAGSTGESVEIALDEDDGSGMRGNGVAETGVTPIEDDQVAEVIEDVSDHVDVLAESPSALDPRPVRRPLAAVGKVAARVDARATQVMPALSEEDIARAVAEAEAAARAKSQSDVAAPAPVTPAASEPSPPAAVADGAPEPLSMAADAPVASDRAAVRTVTEAVAEAVGATIEPGDSSDSGEMLTDDLLEEFDQGTETVRLTEEALQVEAAAVDGSIAAMGSANVIEATGPVAVPTVHDYDDERRARTVIEPVEELSAVDVVELAADEPVSPDTPTQPQPASMRPSAPKPAPPPPKPAPVTVRPKPPPAPPGSGSSPPQQQPGGPQPKRRKGKPWFEEIFDEDYLRTLPFLTPQQTQRQAKFVIDALGVDAGCQLLDVGCGYGRHAMELAARGYHVVGLDSSLPLLIRGADEAQRRGLTINFVHGDMRELTFEDQFDGVYCLFGTFGYFDDETNKKAAQGIARSLKPGARFVVEVLNRDYLVSDLPSRVWWEGDGCVVLEEVEFNYFSSRVNSNRSVVFDDGRQLEQEISIRAYSLHELGKLLHAAGFRILEVSGSMDTKGRFFGAQSREIVIVAERRGNASSKYAATSAAESGDDVPSGPAAAVTSPDTPAE